MMKTKILDKIAIKKKMNLLRTLQRMRPLKSRLQNEKWQKKKKKQVIRIEKHYKWVVLYKIKNAKTGVAIKTEGNFNIYLRPWIAKNELRYLSRLKTIRS